MLPLSPDSPAYVLFIEEVDKHLAFARSQCMDDSPIAADAAKKMGAAFHTIRGSAGFFGLSEIAELARTLEERFFAYAGGAAIDLQQSKLQLDQLIALAEKLPRAAQ